jgi:cytochrome c peroxidase
MAGGATLATLSLLSSADERVSADAVDYEVVRADIVDVLDAPGYDDGSMGPVLVRLAWHASGSFCQFSKSGGSDGATMRFAPESAHGANAGLEVARDLLSSIKQKHPGISYADLWTLAGAVAIEEMAGPSIKWRPGRSDRPDGSYCPPDGRLPDASRDADHIRAVFYRMGFNDQETVALIGAHAIGRCHASRSGFEGPWTRAPTMLSSEFFRELLENKWSVKQWNGPKQYADPTGELMMLPTDLALRDDPEFRKWTELYAADEERFFADFASAFSRLMELGCNGLKPLPRPSRNICNVACAFASKK